MIPIFPQFKRLQISDKHSIELITSGFAPYSDYNFSSLFCWDINNSCEISTLNENLVIRFIDYIDTSTIYSFLGNQKIEETVDTLFNAFGQGFSLSLLPESNFDKKDYKALEENYLIAEDRDEFDYILSVEDFAMLEHPKMQKKRNLVKKFVDTYPSHTVSVLEKTPEVRFQIESLFQSWVEVMGKHDQEIDNEYRAIDRVFSYIYSNLLILGVYDGGKLISFSINDLSWDNYAVTHFEKSDYSFYGVSTYIKHVLAKILIKRGYRKINYEQDLGIEGLRNAKMMLHPIEFLKKYTIEQK